MGSGGRVGAWGDGTDVRSFVHSLGRTEINPLCSIGHRPLRVRCAKAVLSSWADTKVCLEWITKTLAPEVKDLDHLVLLFYMIHLRY